MSNPTSGWDKVPVFGTYKNLDGTPKTGQIVLTLTDRITMVDGSVIYPGGGQLVMPLDSSGSAHLQSPAIDDPDITPADWSIKVEEKLTDGSGKVYYIQPRLSDLPNGINLASVVVPPGSPAAPPPALIKGVPGGVAGLDSDGDVVNASGQKITGGGTSGPVTSASITDATTIGKQLLTATDAGAARTAISAGDGVYSHLTGLPVLGSAAAQPTSAFATAAQGGRADTAVQPADLTAAIAGVSGAGNLTPTATKTTAYTAAALDLVLCDATAGTFAVTLPTAPADGTRIAVKKVDNSANNPTVACGASDTFESGSTSFAIATQWRTVVFQYHAGVWYAVAMYVSIASLQIPNDFGDLAGNVAVGQLPAGLALTQPFTDANYGTVARPTARTDVTVLWVGDSTTTSAHLPANRIAGDVVLTSQG